MMLDLTTLKAAHQHSSEHRSELGKSDLCGCFFCRTTFKAEKIEEWLGETENEASDSDTALCPLCGVDSVIGSASGYPVNSPEFLQAMHQCWF